MRGVRMGDYDEWQRRLEPLTTVVPYALLAVLAALTVAVKHQAGGSLWIDLGLCGLAATWILLMYTLWPARRASPRAMGVFLAGLILITLVLVIRDPWFGFYVTACYFYAFRIIGWPAQLFFIGGTAVVAGTAQAAGITIGSWGGAWAYLAVVLANLVPMCGLAFLGQVGERHYREREAALRAATEANHKLAAALAENAGLQQRLVAQTLLDERQRMAREIHDTLAQGLTGIITQLQAAAHAADDPVAWRRHHDAATALARESLTEARRSVHELRPEALATGRLGEALADVAERWSARHGVAAQVTTTGTVRPMATEAEVALLRTAQEALANVAKHASAGRVALTLSYLDDQVALDVRDDGRGFDPGRPADGRRDGGFGLVAMRQRIEGLAGTLQIESEPGAGTGISACLPAPTTAEVRP